jgi:cellobiose phosphorylase
MAVMYANALYQRGLVDEGYRVLAGIYKHCQDFSKSRMYPGIPEYINPKGRGMYPWLTGSASWYLLTMVREVFGVGGISGDLLIDPKLVSSQFDGSGKASLTTIFADKLIEVTYHNPDRLDYGRYRVISISIDGKTTSCSFHHGKPVIARAAIMDRPAQTVNIRVRLGKAA